MVTVRCILPDLANNCLHSFTSAKIYLFTESDKELLSIVREDLAEGPSLMFTLKVVNKIHIRKSTNSCKSIIGTNDGQHYLSSTCQRMPLGLYPKYEFDADFERLKPRQNTNRSFENTVVSYFQRKRQDYRIESF